MAEPGKTTAIIGSTGCGKSTLVNLIPRLYDATEGSITLDGENIKNISMKELRNELGYVPQMYLVDRSKDFQLQGLLLRILRYLYLMTAFQHSI